MPKLLLILMLFGWLVSQPGVSRSVRSLERVFNRIVLADKPSLTKRGIRPFADQFFLHPDYQTDGWSIILKNRMMLWSLVLYPAADLQTAYRHQIEDVQYPLMEGGYLVNSRFADDLDLTGVDIYQLIESPETTIAFYEVDWQKDGVVGEMDQSKWVTLSAEQFAYYLPAPANRQQFPINVIPSSVFYGNRTSYRVLGIADRKVSGVNHVSALENKNLRFIISRTHTLLRDRGYRIVFNQRLEETITRLQNQQRRGQSLDMNRHRDPVVANNLRSAFAAGNAFSVLLIDPQDHIVAGSVGFVDDHNLFSPDSVFADKIDDAKVAYFSLVRYLKAHGIEFLNAGMVTPFTASIKGYRVTRAEFDQMADTLPTTKITLPASGWRESISIVVASKKNSPTKVAHRLAETTLPRPLIVVESTSGEYPHRYNAKNNSRLNSLRQVIANLERFTIYENGQAPQVFDNVNSFPPELSRYLQEIDSIDVETIAGIVTLRITSLSGFPASLLEEML